MLLKPKTRTRAFTMMFVPHYDSPVRVVRIPFSLVYAIIVVLVLSSVLMIQVVYRYNSMETGIKTLQKCSNTRLIATQRETIHTLNNELANVSRQFATASEFLSYLDNLDPELKSSIGFPSKGSSWNEALAANDLPSGVTPKPASFMPDVVANLEQTAKNVLDESANKERTLAILRTCYQESNDLIDHTPNGWPCDGPITSVFGWRTWTQSQHNGVDIIAPTGTPLHATASGEVVRAEKSYSGYGIYVDILHRDGIVTRYAHCSEIFVKVGESVKRGQVVANCGETGNADCPHCHYEIRVNNEPVDPQKFPF